MPYPPPRPKPEYLSLEPFGTVHRNIIRDALFTIMHRCMQVAENRAEYFALHDAVLALQHEAAIIYIELIPPRSRLPVLLALVEVAAVMAATHFVEHEAEHGWHRIERLQDYAWGQIVALKADEQSSTKEGA